MRCTRGATIMTQSVLLIVVLVLAFAVPEGALANSEGSLETAETSKANGLVQDPNPITQVATPWHAQTVQDLWNEYSKIFKYGNRNAASHLWSTFILERSAQMSAQKLELMFSGFCAVSGSPVRPNDYNRYLLRLNTVTGKKRTGTMHYCCWPCVCDTQDFIRVDTKTITTSEGPKKYHWTVLGNPCDRAYKLNEPFVQPFGVRKTTLAQEAAEVRCVDGKLQGATLSDNGYPIINMFFDLPNSDELSRAGDEVQNEARRQHEAALAAKQAEDSDRQNATHNTNTGNSGLSVINSYMDESPGMCIFVRESVCFCVYAQIYAHLYIYANTCVSLISFFLFY